MSNLSRVTRRLLGELCVKPRQVDTFKVQVNCIAYLDQLLQFAGLWSDYSVPKKLLGMLIVWYRFIALISVLIRESFSF